VKDLLPGLYHAPNVHPLVVHFPVALWTAALLFLGIGSLRRRDDLFRAGCWLIYLGLAGAAVSVGTGLWAEDKLGHDSPGHELVHVHRTWMIVASGFGVLTAGAAFLLRKRTAGVFRWAITGAMVVTVTVMTLGADRGAELVFRYGVGTRRDVLHPVEKHDGRGEHGGAAGPSDPSPAVRPAESASAGPTPSAEPQTPTRDAAPPPAPKKAPRHDHAPGEHGH